MTLKVTLGNQNCYYSIGYISLPISCMSLVVRSNNVSILQHLQILPHPQCTWLPVIARGSSVWNYKPCIRFNSCTYSVIITCYISQGMGVRKVSNSKDDLQGH